MPKRKQTYQFGFDPGGALLFFVIMIPNLIWFLVPATSDVMRVPSTTPRIDFLASMVQIFLVGSICLVRSRRTEEHLRIETVVWLLALILIYFLSWGVYYVGHTELIVIAALCLAPTSAFVLYASARKNGVALLFAWLFLILHTAHWLINYIIPVYRRLH